MEPLALASRVPRSRQKHYISDLFFPPALYHHHYMPLMSLGLMRVRGPLSVCVCVCVCSAFGFCTEIKGAQSMSWERVHILKKLKDFWIQRWFSIRSLRVVGFNLWPQSLRRRLSPSGDYDVMIVIDASFDRLHHLCYLNSAGFQSGQLTFILTWLDLSYCWVKYQLVHIYINFPWCVYIIVSTQYI